ncbi:hypothetical protein ACFQWB_04725 [Paenibacillus thermoaerophilus]|uniref:Uncharacterized protein n=1 Tax=Paenibacillus thermoaerophilus TaxID=1215385 RepID=A0ABW2V1R8_9BACL|nr:hypothetical protein [Paenibacillus thermoaerophilus]TMV17414.1 hypothetical protein FE781_06685 [Paenibacillus thermoaerophilus]
MEPTERDRLLAGLQAGDPQALEQWFALLDEWDRLRADHARLQAEVKKLRASRKSPDTMSTRLRDALRE